MRSLKSGLVSIFVAGLLGTAAIVGCSADGGGVDIGETTDTDPTEDEGSNALPPSNPGNGGGSTTPPKKDAGKDSGKTDAAKDAGPPPPNPGDACSKVNEIFKKDCGACGKQEALCLPGDGGASGVVSDYGPCQGEVAGGCVPGSTEDVPCGNCGTAKKTCNQYCAWSTSACQGQPANSCAPGTVEYITAGCTAPQTYRERTCSGTCIWGNYTGTCAAPNNPNKLTISNTAAGTVVGTYTLTNTKMAKRVTGSCPNGSVSTTTDHPYEIVEVKNAGTQTAKVSAWLSGTPAIDTVMQAYSTNLPPTSDNELKSCAFGTNDFCPTALPCGDDDWSGLTGTQSITIPPGQVVLIRFSSYYTNSSTNVTTGSATLTVRTDSFM